MRVLFVVDGGIDEPAARARAYGLVAALSRRGVQALVLAPRERAGLRGKRRLLRAARQAEVVVLQRVMPPRLQLAALARVNPALVFDFDDALHEIPARRDRLAAVLETAVEVVAGSEELAGHARLHHRSVTVVPTTVDPCEYAPAGRGDNDQPVRIGWIGTPGNLPYVELVRPALDELVKRGRAIEVRIISSVRPRWPELAVTHIQWTLDGAARTLSELDIGVAPLPDTPWTRGKCGLKAIEYMASGLPVVASPVGALSEIVLDGRTGLLAAGRQDWVDRLDILVGDAGLRRRLGLAGRRRMEERYSVDVAAATLAGVLERAVASARSSPA